MRVPFVGPSYSLDFRKSDVQRSINLFVSVSESGTSKSPAVLQSIPGYGLWATIGAELRGMYTAGARLFAVAGNTLYELSSSGVATSRGTLLTSTGPVDMAHGLNQLVVVDGNYGYVLTLATNAFARITDSAFYGSDRVGFLNGYFLFIRPDTQQYYWSAIDDASDLDALDFKSAEYNPDGLVALLVDHMDVLLFGALTTEGHRHTGTELVFERNEGLVIEIGCAAPFTARKLDNTVFWLGRDKDGEGQVWMLEQGSPRKVSTRAVEEALQASTDLSAATAYTHKRRGNVFYHLNAPGLETTWVFNVTTGQWHEEAELVNGEYEPIRGTCHAHAFGKNLIGAADGKIYYLDESKNTLNGSTLVRDRISPHNATPSMEWISFARFALDCVVGKGRPNSEAPSVQMRYSDDGGMTWSQWKTASLGAIGQYAIRVVFGRAGLGRARDRVWHVRCTDDAPFSIVNAVVEET